MVERNAHENGDLDLALEIRIIYFTWTLFMNREGKSTMRVSMK